MAVITQVSSTIVVTRRESKTNHASLKQFLFLWKLAQRQKSSNEKKTQKQCSTI